MRELERLLPDLEPPAGGLQHLQQHIGGQRAARTHRWPQRMAWAVALALPLLAVVIWLPPQLARQQRTHAMVDALRQGLASDLPANGIRVTDGAAIELPSGQANVRLYLVQSAATTTDAPQHVQPRYHQGDPSDPSPP